MQVISKIYPFKAILVLFAFVFFASVEVRAQVFTVKLIVDIEKGDLSNVWITITKGGATYRTINPNGKSKFNVDFELGGDYLITVTKPNYITKSVIVSTDVPAGRADNEFAKFSATIELSKQPEGQEVTYTQPVGKIKYSYTAGDFDYDTEYISQAKEMQKKAEAAPKPKPKVEPPPPPVSKPIPVEVKQPEYKPEPEKPKPVVKEPEPIYKPVTKNKEERIIQKDRLKITIVIVTVDDTPFEYKKEEYAWGGVYYYKNGKNITANTFEKETE
ncbi:MAG: hypothetical protein JNL69_09355 [Bacteroidia bacterium]|nr:hypothetical protein [Bacteroidia bacterium]